VDWASSKAWLRQMSASIAADSMGTTINSPLNYWDIGNGYIYLAPFTKLETPDGSDMPINIYVSSDKMLFNQTTPMYLPTVRRLTESKESAFDEVTCFDMNPTGASYVGVCEDYFGELPLSFRSLLHRFETTDATADAANATTRKSVIYTGKVFPDLLPTFAADATTPTLFNYLRYAFLGMKGTVVKRFRYANLVGSAEANNLKAYIDNPSTSTTARSIAYSTTLPRSDIRGVLSWCPNTNAGVEFGIPFYNQNLFLWTGIDPFNATTTQNSVTGVRNYFVEYEAGATGTIAAVEETAFGDDFYLGRFVGSPPYAY